MGIFNVTEQRLVDQKNNILSRKKLSDLELEEIQRNILTLGILILWLRGTIKTKHKDGLEQRYKIKRRGLPVAREEIKERIKAKNNKIKR